jgi:hypothetical protein
MMKSGWRMLIAAAAAAQALTAGAASAQNAVTPAPAGNATEVGPAQLRDFTLNGTVTRPAETRAPQAAPPAPAPSTQAPRTQSSTTTLRPARSPSPSAPVPAPTQRSATVELPPPSASAALPPAGGQLIDVAQGADPPTSVVPEPVATPNGTSFLPWLLVALLIGAGGAYYLFRVRPRAQLATAEGAMDLRAPPQPQPAPAPPPVAEPRARAALPAGGAVVSTNLRPWIEIDFIPERTIVAEDTITIHFAAALYNSGSAPARDVRIEAALFNASPSQDQQITAFFAQAAGGGDRIDMVAPLQRVTVRSSIIVPRAQIRPLLAQGRPLLVPMTALTVVYRWGSNNNGQTSASYLVGKQQADSEKLAPFRLDVGPRVFRGLAARTHQLRVRN